MKKPERFVLCVGDDNAGATEHLVKPNYLEKLTETVVDLIEKQ